MEQRPLLHKSQGPMNKTIDAFPRPKRKQHVMNLDLEPNVKITGRECDMSPDHVAKQLRRNNINHLKYDKNLFKDTKSRVCALLSNLPSQRGPSEQDAYETLCNLDKF